MVNPIAQRRARLWLAGYLVVVLALTLTPVPAETRPPILVPISGIRLAFEQGGAVFGVVQLVGNLLLLAPMGALMPLAFRGVGGREVVTVALVLSLAIELTQWWMDAGRQPDIDDLWTNTLGAALGAALGVALGWWQGRRPGGTE